MNRFHVHVSVMNLDQSIRFYSALFALPPTRTKDDYAKWELDDPAVNFAISERGRSPGINHLGIQVDAQDRLEALHDSARAAELDVLEEPAAHCCYARSDKHWVTDPQGVAWEFFHTHGQDLDYGQSRPGENSAPSGSGENGSVQGQ